jgi:hypothetical protein
VPLAAKARRAPREIHSAPLKTSICEALANPVMFDGKLVEVHAEFSATWEGEWVSDSECNSAGQLLVPPAQRGLAKPYADAMRDAAKRYGRQGVVKDKAWQEFDSASHHLYTGMGKVSPDGTTKWGDYDYIAADFTGVLVVKRTFRVRHGFGNGWGHLGMSRFLLVLTSLSSVSPHPCACPSSELRPPILESPPNPCPRRSVWSSLTA